MDIKLEKLDSIAFGANVLKINEVNDNINFSQFESEYIKKYNPKYVYSKVNIGDINKIHYLEQNGFEFVECQLELFKRVTEPYDMSTFENRYKVQSVNFEDLEEIFEVSDKVFNAIDRIFIDEKIPVSIAQKRYHIYLKNSLEQENQRFDKLLDLKNNEIIGFHTLLYTGDKSVTLLLGGVLPEYHSSGVNYLLDYSVYNDLFKSGHKNITTHISAGNIKIMNYLIKVLNFKVKKTCVVLRKLY